MKYLFTILFAIFAMCCIAFASDTVSAETVTDAPSVGSVIIAAVGGVLVIVINAVLSLFPSKSDAWWYKLLSVFVLRFGNSSAK